MTRREKDVRHGEFHVDLLPPTKRDAALDWRLSTSRPLFEMTAEHSSLLTPPADRDRAARLRCRQPAAFAWEYFDVPLVFRFTNESGTSFAAMSAGLTVGGFRKEKSRTTSTAGAGF